MTCRILMFFWRDFPAKVFHWVEIDRVGMNETTYLKKSLD